MVTVTAGDTCGNTGTLTEPITVVEQPPSSAAKTVRLAAWPRIHRGWTVVIASLADRRGAADAREAARTAVAAGLRRVGIVRHRGSRLVVSGTYFSPEDAQDALARVARRYPRAFVRELVSRIQRPAHAGRKSGSPGRTT